MIVIMRLILKMMLILAIMTVMIMIMIMISITMIMIMIMIMKMMLITMIMILTMILRSLCRIEVTWPCKNDTAQIRSARMTQHKSRRVGRITFGSRL